MLMDSIFGASNFRNEIVWHYKKWTNTAKYFQRNHDVIFGYSKTDKYTFNKLYGEPTKRQLEIRQAGYNVGTTNSGAQIVRVYDKNNPKVVEKLNSGAWKGREIYYVDAPSGNPIPDVWQLPIVNPQSKEKTGFPTQKPMALLERIVQASSNEGDFVLDPFCGCATSLIAAERLNRRWIGIDISEKAFDLVKSRMQSETNLFDRFNPIHRTDIPQRTDIVTKASKADEDKRVLFGQQQGYCNGCKRFFEFRNLTVDHIIAKAIGGTDHIENKQLLCGSCNSTKGKSSHEELIVKLRKTGILK